MKMKKSSDMNFVFFLISIILVSSLAGTAFAQQEGTLTYQTIGIEREFTEEEINDMKHKAVLITLQNGSFMIEFFPEDAPNTVYNFLKLVESGYYDGVIFHRIIPGFMIQAGDPVTKDPDTPRVSWGSGGPGYNIKGEFNALQHDRGIVSMARSSHPDSAGSQFFIVHKDSHHLDGQYTVFGRLVPGLPHALDFVTGLETDLQDKPLDRSAATIKSARVISPFVTSDLVEPSRIPSVIKEEQRSGGSVQVYQNNVHNVVFDIPYRWEVTEGKADFLNVIIKPGQLEYDVQKQIEQSGVTPQILVSSEKRTVQQTENNTFGGFFSLKGATEPKILSNYIFQNDEGQKAHVMVSTQEADTAEGTKQFKAIQMHFANSDTNYSVIYVHAAEWFRYEINAFVNTADNFKIMIDGKLQPTNFDQSTIFKQIITDAKAVPEPESLPPARIGGCLIATASYGSELAPQVQLLREIRDNTVLQTESGTSFMTGFNQFYYSFSPAIADYERENPVFKEIVKLTLTPLITSLTLLQYADIDSESEMLGYGISLILLNIGMYFVAPAVLITKIRSFYKLQ